MKPNLNISDAEWEEIELFLSGKLEPSAEAIFKNKISEDGSFEKKVAHVRQVILGIREAALSSELRNVPLSGHHHLATRKPSGKKFFIGWMSGAAAAIVILALLYFGLFKKSEEKLFAKYYYPDSGLISTMGASDKYAFDVAMIHYKSGQYQKAIEAWKALLKPGISNDTLNYFMGNAYLAMDETQQSISYLTEVTKDTASVFRKDAEWYLGLAFLKSGKKDEAINHIAQSENEKKEELLQLIRK